MSQLETWLRLSTELNQNAEEATETNGFDDAQDGGYVDPGLGSYGGSYPGDRGGYPGGRSGNRGYPGGGRGGRGRYCLYGCCGRGYYSRGCRCCTYAGEAAESNTEAEPHN